MEFLDSWVRLCGVGEAPAVGEVKEAEAQGAAICLANVDGQLSALDNWCPHRRGPLGQGWIEGRNVVCPWHCWAFDAATGDVQEPERGKVSVYPLKVEAGDILVNLG